MRERPLGSLEGYLERAAVDLDERGDQLRERAAALERRLAELGLAGDDERVDRLAGELEDRDAKLKEALAELEGERRLLAETARARAEEAERLADAERELTAVLARLEERERQGAEQEAVGEELELLLSRVSEKERALAATESRLQAETARAAAAESRLAELPEIREGKVERERDRKRATASDGATGAPAPEGESGAPRPAATPGAGHLLFVPFSDRYVLVEREGDAPPPGEEVALPDVNELRFRVSRLGRSPLPGDHRRCAYLEALD